VHDTEHRSHPDDAKEVERHRGVVIEAMRIEFTIERTLKKHPNSCSVKLTNLNEASRAAKDGF